MWWYISFFILPDHIIVKVQRCRLIYKNESVPSEICCLFLWWLHFFAVCLQFWWLVIGSIQNPVCISLLFCIISNWLLVLVLFVWEQILLCRSFSSSNLCRSQNNSRVFLVPVLTKFLSHEGHSSCSSLLLTVFQVMVKQRVEQGACNTDILGTILTRLSSWSREFGFCCKPAGSRLPTLVLHI